MHRPIYRANGPKTDGDGNDIAGVRLPAGRRRAAGGAARRGAVMHR
jgi:hypothetical protein